MNARQRNRRIGLLLAVHLVGGLVLFMLPRSIWFTHLLFYAIIHSQAYLLGIWGALSARSWQRRIGCMLLGIVYLSALGQIVHQNVINVFLSTGALWMILIPVRRYKRELLLFEGNIPTIDSVGFRYSIRYLFLLTLIVAVLLAVGQWGRTLLLPSSAGYRVLFMAMSTSVYLWYILFSLALLWASLSKGRPVMRIVVVIAMAFGVGFIPSFMLFFGGGNVPSTQPFPSVIPAMLAMIFTTILVFTLFHAAILTSSLLVVRSCGYRLVPVNYGYVGEVSQSPAVSRPINPAYVEWVIKNLKLGQRAAVGVLVAGVGVTFCGAVLLAQEIKSWQPLAGKMHIAGELMMLGGLAIFLIAHVAARNLRKG